MEDAIPLMNSINAPLELCEQAQQRFLQFLNSYTISEHDGEHPSQSGSHSLRSGASD